MLAANRAPVGTVCLTFVAALVSREQSWAHCEVYGSTVTTIVHLFSVLVMSVLTYSAETWTLLSADLGKLQAFHMDGHEHV